MKQILLIFIFVAYSMLNATEKKTICLSMIIKNESESIRRCLASVKPFIDYWVIVDTGSTDGTQKIVKEFMKDIPGELHEKPWVDFSHNRTEAVSLTKGKGDYVFYIDADEELLFDKNFVMPDLDLDLYFWPIRSSGSHWQRPQLLKNGLNWKWIGVLHEYLEGDAKTQGILEGLTTITYPEGYRSQDPKKFENDAILLEEALKKDPNNTRHVFYLAQSYKDAGNYKLAVQNYKKRATMGGWDEEIFWSLYQVAYLQELLQEPSDVIIKGYCTAFQYRPTRAEPLCRLAMYFRSQGNYLLSYAIANLGASITEPKDFLMIEEWVYDYWLRMEKAIGAYWVGKYAEANSEAIKLLINPKFPEEMHIYAEEVVKWTHPHLPQINVIKK